MKLRTTLLFSLLTLSSVALGQEGHPLKGSWIGEWSGNKSHDEFVLIVLDWDGKNVTGVINPGTDDIVIDKVELDPANWTVTIDADTEVDGKQLNYEITGTIDQLELPTRSINGTWKSESGAGDFQISRQ